MARPALDFDSIRALVDTGLTAEELPPATIALDCFLGSAWRRALRRDPLADSYLETSADAAAVASAVQYLTAAEICLGWQPVQSQSFAGGEYSVRFAAWDGPARAASLRALAEQEFAAYLEETDAGIPLPPFAFAVASGQRGR